MTTEKQIKDKKMIEGKLADKTAEKQLKARGKPFPKGVSGNPIGRPKGRKNWNTLFELALEKIIKEKKLPIEDPEVEMVIRAVIKALKGNYNFFRDLMDRRYGKPKEPIELEEKIDKIIVEIVQPKENERNNEENNLSLT